MQRNRRFEPVVRLEPLMVTTSANAASPEALRADRPDSFGSGRLFASGGGGSDPERKTTVRVQRRRRTESPGPEGRERAEAPRRERPDKGSATPPPRPPRQTTSRPRPTLPSGGRPLPGGRGSLLIIALVIVCGICALSALLILGPGNGGDVADLPSSPTPSLPQVASPSAPTLTPEPFIPPSTITGDGSWLVMLYQDADDQILEQDIYVDLNEAERVGSSERLHIVAQVDRYEAGYQGDGNWTTAKRFYITQDDDLQRVHSDQVADLGEVNMSDGNTLVDFVTWAVETFPADRHALILSDHGMGWPGGWSDASPAGSGDRSIPLSARLGDELYLMELDEALTEIRARTGLEKLEMIGLDACLMGHLEVYSVLAPHARYAVASQETEPALGWAYTGFLEALRRNPGVDGAELGRLIVNTYIEEDQRIVDDQARAELLRQGSPLGGLLGGLLGGSSESATQLAQRMGQGITLTAVDLAALPELINSVNDLSFTLQGERQPEVARARTYAQSFTSVFGKDAPPSYIDLGNFVQFLKKNLRGGAVTQAADRVLSALSQVILAEKHGPQKPGATGISVYFPNSQLYQSPLTGPQSYTAIARRFAEESLWDDFLAYHYTGRPFEAAAPAVAVPEPGTAVKAPGSGRIEVAAVTLSDSAVAPGQPVLMSIDIRGRNIGYVYLFVGFYDQVSNSIFVADRDYLESSDTREIDGIYYPVWPEETEFTVEFEWEPVVFALSDGTDRVVALFSPQTYGALPEEAVYTVDGLYTDADGGDSRYARLYFRDGSLRQIFGFTGEGGTGAPREIIPQPGDRFTVLERWLDLDSQGRVAQTATQEGGTLTFRDQMFTWLDLDAAPGSYVVGFVVEDLDGNAYETYERLRVE